MRKVISGPKPDPAKGGYYVVQDRGDGGYDVCGYTAKGALLLHTTHTTKTSMEIECEAWKARGAAEHRMGHFQGPR